MNLAIDCEQTSRIISTAIANFFKKNNFEKAVLGLSGGVDSALVLKLLSNALGSANCFALLLPYKTSSPESIADARELAAMWEVPYEIIDISEQIDAYFKKIPQATPLQIGNKCARERMSILYDFSSRIKALVVGTSNKSELLVGYSTQFGDSAAALLPLGDLYKTQVWQLADYLEIPEKIIRKTPSADLWTGQSDEQELGIKYQRLDAILFQIVDLRLSDEEIISNGYQPEEIKKVRNLIVASQYKRSLPVIIKISSRTVSHDFRFPRDWNR